MRHVALLRGINVGGRNLIAMPELRALCGELGWSDVRSYIQSGNLVFSARAAPPRLEARLEQAIVQRFGLAIPVIVRTHADWAGYIGDNPYPDAAKEQPNLLLLALSRSAPKPDAVERLRERADGGERITRTGGVLWIHFPGGVGKSRLSPSLCDRLVGSPVTMRNWRTVQTIDALVRAAH